MRTHTMAHLSSSSVTIEANTCSNTCVVLRACPTCSQYLVRRDMMVDGMETMQHLLIHLYKHNTIQLFGMLQLVYNVPILKLLM